LRLGLWQIDQLQRLCDIGEGDEPLQEECPHLARSRFQCYFIRARTRSWHFTQLKVNCV
jgi:hypothetical protein